MEPREQQVRTWSMLCHLSALAGFLSPILIVLGPLIIWQIKKNELPEIDPHGKAAVNFQLTILLINIAASIIIFGFLGLGFGWHMGMFWRSPFTFFGGGFGFGMLLGLINLAAWILALIAGLKANSGEFFKYPFAIQFIK